MIIILDEIREMIAIQGGNPSTVHDISEGLVTLKRLLKANINGRRDFSRPVEQTMVTAEGETGTESRRSRKK